MNRIKVILFLLLLPLSSLASEIKGTWYKLPRGSLHMEPVLFLAPSLFQKLQTEQHMIEGEPVIISRQKKHVNARVYKSLRHGTTFSMSRKLGRKIGLKAGINQLAVEIADQSHLTFRPLFPHHTEHPGSEQWKGYVIAAPHGDCDWFTGQIAESLNKKIKLPALTSYSCRFPYRGIWFDCNRPLMKRPLYQTGVNGIQVAKQREWNNKAESVYNDYQKKLHLLSQINNKRITFLMSLHGHDLTVRSPDGHTISKDVIEGIGIGFSHSQLRQIKAFYNNKIRKYFNNPPPIYFGNLPEDQTFKVHGVKSYFMYSAVGTRLSGSLRSDLLRYGLHLETPNSLRITKASREKLVRFLAELYPFIKNLINAQSLTTCQKNIIHKKPRQKNSFITIEQSPFLMGSSFKQDWANEKPQHKIYLSTYQISAYEVTNKEFAHFLNHLLKQGQAYKQQGTIYNRNNKVLARTYPEFPLSQLDGSKDLITPLKSKEHHPVVHVTYYGARSYAQYIGGKLPTEAQWEKAASWDSKNSKKFRFAAKDSNNICVEDTLQSYGNLNTESREVGTTSSNVNGLYDMSGNAWEWTEDWYADNTYKERGNNIYDPQGPENGTMKTIRGGSWNMEKQVSRTTMRTGFSPSHSSVSIGFRVVLEQ